MFKFVAIAVAASTFDCTPQVEATFSLVATDSQTRMVGGVGASCNASSDIFDGLYIAAPGKSVLVTQALLLERGSEIVHKAEELMRDETPPIDVLATMRKMDKASQKTKVGTFPTESLRQYGMASFQSNAGFTGEGLERAYELAEMSIGTEQVDIGSDGPVNGRFRYHAQGNVVAEGTVQAMESAFLLHEDGVEGHCALARRLMSAMEAVSSEGLGDTRCTKNHSGVTSTGAYIHIDNPDGSVAVHINVIGDGTYEPIDELARRFLEWQKSSCSNIENSSRRLRRGRHPHQS